MTVPGSKYCWNYCSIWGCLPEASIWNIDAFEFSMKKLEKNEKKKMAGVLENGHILIIGSCGFFWNNVVVSNLIFIFPV